MAQNLIASLKSVHCHDKPMMGKTALNTVERIFDYIDNWTTDDTLSCSYVSTEIACVVWSDPSSSIGGLISLSLVSLSQALKVSPFLMHQVPVTAFLSSARSLAAFARHPRSFHGVEKIKTAEAGLLAAAVSSIGYNQSHIPNSIGNQYIVREPRILLSPPMFGLVLGKQHFGQLFPKAILYFSMSTHVIARLNSLLILLF